MMRLWGHLRGSERILHVGGITIIRSQRVDYSSQPPKWPPMIDLAFLAKFFTVDANIQL